MLYMDAFRSNFIVGFRLLFEFVFVALLLFVAPTAQGTEIVADFPDPNHNLVSNVVKLADGERYNLRSGELSYYKEDFFIPGTGLPIRLGRRNHREVGYFFEFSNMSLEMPRIEFYTAMSHIKYKVHCGGGGCDTTDYSTIESISPGNCSGYKHIAAGQFHSAEGGDTTWWTYDTSDLAQGIRLYINNKKINFFTREGYQGGSRFPAAADYVSPDNWYVDCAGNSGDEMWKVHSPDGTIYHMSTYEFLPTKNYPEGPQEVQNIGNHKIIVYVTSVTDKYGNSLSYNYHSEQKNFLAAYRKQYLDSISASDGRLLTISYINDRVSAIYDNSTTNQRRLDYSYSGSPLTLHRVTRLDGTFWQYGSDILYCGSSSANGLQLSSVTTPKGATYNYQYHGSSYVNDDWNCPLKTRTVSDSSLPAGMTWSYAYHDIGNNQLVTYVSGPANSQKYVHRKLINHYYTSMSYQDTGRLLSHSVYPQGTGYGSSTPALQQTSYIWNRRPSLISDATISQGLGWHTSSTLMSGYELTGRMLAYNVSMQQEPSSVTTAVDGKTFTRTYPNFDNWDNAQQVGETGNAGTRTTNYTYHNDTNNWVVGKLKDETVVGGGQGIVRTYNGQGKLDTKQEFGLSPSTFSYYPAGHASAGELSSISRQRDGAPLTEYYQNYFRGVARTEIDPDGHSLTLTVNDDGTVASVTDKNGNTTSYTYDAVHRLDTITTPLYSWTNIDWTNSGRTKTTTQGNNVITEEFDALGRLIETVAVDITDPANDIQTTIAYGASGRVSYQSLPKTSADTTSVGLSYAYDALQRVKTLTHTGDSTVTTYCYQVANCSFASGILDFGYAMTDPRGFHSVHNFEAYGEPGDSRLLNIHDTTGTTPASAIDRLTSIDRNIYGDITSIGRANTVRTYGYSSTMPRQIQTVTEPEVGVTTYTYRSDGSLESTKTGASGLTQYAHDNSGRVVNIDYPGATPDVTNSYYPNGELWTSAIDGTLWNYDLNSENDLSQETLSIDSLTFATHYTYDNLGNTQTIQYPSGRSITQGNDALGRTRNISTYISSTDYYPNGQLSSITFGNGQVTTITQNAKHYPENYKTAHNGNILVDKTYTYDKNNNIESITDTILGNKALDYDGVNRLFSADGPWGTGNTIHAGIISYDHNDNITQKTMGTHSLGYVYDASNKLIGTTGSKVYTFGYDHYGNVTSNGVDTFTYNDANQLKTSGSNSYRYDVHNRRVKTTKGAVDQYYVYTSNGRLMHRYNAQSKQTTDYIYLAGKQIAKHDQEPDPLQVTTAPVFSPTGGNHISSVTVSMSTTPVSANPSIRYTTDGSIPTVSSTTYTGPVTFTSNTTLKAKVIGAGFIDSPVTTSNFTIAAVTPTISPNGGDYWDSVALTMTPGTAGGTVYYTTNGSTPTTDSTLYTGVFNLTGSATVKAITAAPGKASSAVTSASFTITPTPTAGAPVISPNGGSYYDSQVVTLSPGTAEGTVYYTTNGVTPTTSSTQYTSAFTLTSSATVRAITVVANHHNSAVSEASFTVVPTPTAAAPVITASGSLDVSVTISAPSPGTVIHYSYTVSGAQSGSGVYSSPLWFIGSGLGVKYTVWMSAYASGPNYHNSSTTTITFTYGRNGGDR